MKQEKGCENNASNANNASATVDDDARYETEETLVAHVEVVPSWSSQTAKEDDTHEANELDATIGENPPSGSAADMMADKSDRSIQIRVVGFGKSLPSSDELYSVQIAESRSACPSAVV